MEIYVDDMLIKSRAEEDHEANLRESFDNLRKYNLRLNLDKCVFVVTFGKFLCYMISQREIEPNPDKIATEQAMQIPWTQKEVQRLTGRIAGLTWFISCAGIGVCLSLKPSRRGGCLNGPRSVRRPFKSCRRTCSLLSRWRGRLQGTSCNFISRVIRGVETRYPLTEKLVYALFLLPGS
ncbi:hypothetical protein LIER_13533 [Lithospermum erythrorhizon]|uniref:Reverse transcriptase domain-containing protein n=1 Tax=Lithospermum erythrorhizon TaxID=34254 RepID=A0AAV3PVS0_LITER